MSYHFGKNTPVKESNFLTFADKILHDRALPHLSQVPLPAFIPLLATPPFLLLRHTKLNAPAELLHLFCLHHPNQTSSSSLYDSQMIARRTYPFAYISSLERQPNISLLKEPPPTPYQLPNHSPSFPLPYFTSFRRVWLLFFHSTLEFTFLFLQSNESSLRTFSILFLTTRTVSVSYIY